MISTQTLSVDGKVVQVTLDQEGKVLYVIFPLDTDPAGNPFTVSFGYGNQVSNVERFISGLIRLLGL